MISPRELWLRTQDRKRLGISIAIVGLLCAVTFGTLVVIGLFSVRKLSNFSGPILVRLGAPEGLDQSLFVNSPVTQQLPPDQPEEAAPPAEEAPPPEIDTPPLPDDQSAVVLQKPSPLPSKRPSPAPSRKPSPAPVKSPVPRTSPRPSSAVALASPQSSPIASAKPAVSPVPLPIKGTEAGNSHETNFGSDAGNVGRSFFAPIYLYLPLPQTVEPLVKIRIRASKAVDENGNPIYSLDAQRQEFLQWYEHDSSTLNYRLKTQPDLEFRGRIWMLLEEANYPLETADYKAGRTLKPVVIDFTVGSNKLGSRLKNERISKSSGDPDIDAAVLYGFRRAGFSNTQERDIKGQFTYYF